MQAKIPGVHSGPGGGLWIPSPERSLTVIAAIAGLTIAAAAIAGVAPARGPEEPAVARATPAAVPTAVPALAGGEGFSLPFGLFRPAQVGPVVLERSPADGVLLLDELLPLSRSFEVLPAASGGLTPEMAAQTWADPTDAIRRYQEWGFITGAAGAYWRPQVNNEPHAPVAVRSNIALFKDVNSADAALRYRREKLVAAKATPLAVGSPDQGVSSFKTPSGPFTHYFVEFRRANAVATLWVAGYAARDDIDIVRSLASTMLGRVR